MKKNLLITIIVIVLVVCAGLVYFGYSGGSLQRIFPSKSQTDLSSTILFFGNGCPHCANVEKFISDNKITDNIKITMSEVPYGNNDNSSLEDNAKILGQVATKCGIQANQVGIPFLWDGKTCTVGDVDIIKYFQGKMTLWQKK